MPRPAGPAHVATVSFLASRAAPTGGFWVALAGGVALARVAQRRGAREGFGASLAAMLESVAIIGPTRFSVPLTQALTAPLLGRLEARSVSPVVQAIACGLVRLLHNAAVTAFFIWVIAGGLDAYAGTYDALGGQLGLEVGSAGALAVTGVGLLGWAAFASAVQVAVYRRGLRRWLHSEQGEAPPVAEAPDRAAARFDPRAVALAAVIAFVLPAGLALTGLLAGGALLFGLVGGLGPDVALRRGLRAALLVLTATWLRAAAGAAGLREVFRRTLGRLGRVPSLPEASRTLGEIGSERRLLAAGRSLAARLRGVRRRPLSILDAVLDWVAHESSRFRPGEYRSGLALRVRPSDALLLALAVSPVLALVLA